MNHMIEIAVEYWECKLKVIGISWLVPSTIYIHEYFLIIMKRQKHNLSLNTLKCGQMKLYQEII